MCDELFGMFRSDGDGGFYNPSDIGEAISRGDVKEVPGSNGRTVYDPRTGKEYDTRDGKPK